MFMTNEALAKFMHKAGWKIGIDASVTIINVDVGGPVYTDRITSPVIGFILDPKGLMYNLTLEGSTINRISR
jgi:lipid-binding SYLF domain-containing protein